MQSTNTVGVRYIVKDVEKAVKFYEKHLGFKVVMNAAPGFAALSRDNLMLFLNQPGSGSAGQPASDGSMPEPGGWSRFQIVTSDLDAEIKRLESDGASFKSGINTGAGGRQILLEDPSGNVVEIFEPRR